MGAVIHTERTARGHTQTQLAQAAGIHPMALSKIERGIQGDIGVDTLQRIANALSQTGTSVTASQLLAAAEQWQWQLYEQWKAGTLPVPAKPKGPDGAAIALSGAALAAVILLLMKGK
ncbi:MAG: helix-turn-helix transcriptional regulator [Deltaproteobacteria bacterium]|nr:helix-turn-helix transcriptional regulator [Deltaproteobacteria bacterium]